MEHYNTLGLSYGASHDEIKKAFRRLAHIHHPDKPSGNEARFKLINHAYQELMKMPEISPSTSTPVHVRWNSNPIYNTMSRDRAKAMRDAQELLRRRYSSVFEGL